MYQLITEGKAKLYVPKEKKVSKDLPVFYNPIMKLSRDISVAVIGIAGKKLQIALPLAGTGVRGIRILRETKNVKNISFNDYSLDAIKLIKKNLHLNNYTKGITIHVHNTDANLFLLQSKGFDYIDIDPFGSPNPFLDAGIKRIAREGILAVTATDTAALCGAARGAGQRKYWGDPLHNYLMHEVGLRILIRKVQLIGAQYERALIPMISYSRDHYFRIFFRCHKGKKSVDEMMKLHQHLLFCSECFSYRASLRNSKVCCAKEMTSCGPLWVGTLKDKPFLEQIGDEISLLKLLREELEYVGFYDIHTLAKKENLSTLPSMEHIISKLESEGYAATRTHFSPTGIKTNAPVNAVTKLLKN